jgi:glucose-6-phosphate 1-epimerase
MTIEQLRRQFSGAVKLSEGSGHLPCLKIQTDLATATIYLHGAHVTQFQPKGHDELLFMSDKSMFAAGKPIRGGVPICWPWFGPKAGDTSAPLHGVARLQEWTVTSITTLPGGEVDVTLQLLPTDLSRPYWPSFKLEHRIRVGKSLSMSLATSNSSDKPVTLNEALHTYLKVGDARNITITGLEGVQYLDRLRDLGRFTEGAQPIAITGETDRVYLNTEGEVTVHDPVLKRNIFVSKSGSRSTVVWNPWIAKAKAMPDFGDDEWPAMLCIETVNAADNAVTIAPGAEHVMTALVRAERL